METTHESPIQAVRKPTQREALRLNSEEDSAREKTGLSLLRKLWCLKATKPKKPPLGSEASPLQRARCGPVTALSRTADPHGESPLRWKPRAERQSPEEAGSLSEPEKAETVHQLEASWLAKPWRTFRTKMAARAKKGSILSGNEMNPGATGEKVLSLPAESETSPATRANKPIREQQNNAVALEDKTPPSTPPSVADELCGSQDDEGANRSPQHRLENHRRMEAILKPVPKLPVCEENGCREDDPILEVVSQLEGITEDCYLPGGRKLAAGGSGTEDKGFEHGDNAYWPELSAGEDLAELAENPGGQGMVMATRGWLTSEGLGGPTVDGKAAVSTRGHPDTQGIGQETGEMKHSDEHASRASPGKTGRASCFFPSSVATSHHSGTTALQEVATSCPAFSQEVNLPTPLAPSPCREFERGAESRPPPTPIQTAALGPPGENSPSPGSPMGQQTPSTTEPNGATSWPATPGPEEKHLIYVAAVEIVEAAIDAAAEQLAKKEERERAGHGGHADGKADSLVGAAKQQHGWLA